MRHLVIVAGVIAVAVVASASGGNTSQGGPPSSSFTTGTNGLSGYAAMLARAGHPVQRLRAALSRAELDSGSTIVVLDPTMLAAPDIAALHRFLQQGGRLIAGGQDPASWLARLLPDPPNWQPNGPTGAVTLAPTAESHAVTAVMSAGAGAWTSAGVTLPTLGQPSATLLNVATVGNGRLELLADASPLQNRLLSHADNALLGLSLAGAEGRPVVFAESVHGFGPSAGLAALPSRWKWALAGLLLAALVYVVSRFRRLGPAEPRPSAPLPPRREHVEALALALSRSANADTVARQSREKAAALQATGPHH